MPRLAQQPSWEGVSHIWRSSKGVTLLLGNTSNALAAMASSSGPAQLCTRHVISVGDSKMATLVKRARCDNGENGAPLHDRYELVDRLRPDDVVEIDMEWEPLVLLCKAFAVCEAEAHECRRHRSAVLVHCNLGHNRSPALVLAFLLSRGLTLRTAYVCLFSGRPMVDPLPPYRAALGRLEVRLHGVRSVDNEPWAKHMSEIIAEQGGDFFTVIELKERAINALLASECGTLRSTHSIELPELSVEAVADEHEPASPPPPPPPPPPPLPPPPALPLTAHPKSID
jgi:hypothetical protein